MSQDKTFDNEYQPARDMTCESSSVEIPFEPCSRRKRLSNISLSAVSIGINLIAVGMLSYALFLIAQRSYRPHIYTVAEGDVNNDFTPLQLMGRLNIDKVPTDSNVLLKIKDGDTLTVRLYQIKSVQAKLDKNKDEIYRTFFLSLGHKLIIQHGTAVLYDESGNNVLAEYDLNSSNVKTAEEDDAEELQTQVPSDNKFRRLFFTKEKMHMKPGHGKGGGYGPPPYNPYGGYGGYCPYCGMYSPYNRYGGGFPFGGGYSGFGGFGGGMGGFGLF